MKIGFSALLLCVLCASAASAAPHRAAWVDAEDRLDVSAVPGGFCIPGLPGGELACATSNGCGPEYLGGGNGPGYLQPACDTHDICYGTLGKTQKECDDAYHRDLIALCNKQHGKGTAAAEGCIAFFANPFYYAVSSPLGTKAYRAAQDFAKACEACKRGDLDLSGVTELVRRIFEAAGIDCSKKKEALPLAAEQDPQPSVGPSFPEPLERTDELANWRRELNRDHVHGVNFFRDVIWQYHEDIRIKECPDSGSPLFKRPDDRYQTRPRWIRERQIEHLRRTLRERMPEDLKTIICGRQ